MNIPFNYRQILALASKFKIAEYAKDDGKLAGLEVGGVAPPPPPPRLAPAGVGQTSLGAGEQRLSSRLSHPADPGALPSASPWFHGLKEPLGLSLRPPCFSPGQPRKVSRAFQQFHFSVLPEEAA